MCLWLCEGVSYLRVAVQCAGAYVCLLAVGVLKRRPAASTDSKLQTAACVSPGRLAHVVAALQRAEEPVVHQADLLRRLLHYLDPNAKPSLVCVLSVCLPLSGRCRGCLVAAFAESGGACRQPSRHRPAQAATRGDRCQLPCPHECSEQSSRACYCQL
jgi:hypothetical protein